MQTESADTSAQNLRVQYDHCLYTTANFTSIRVTNVCTGAVTHIPRGTVDILLPVVFVLLLGGMAYVTKRILA